MLYIVFPLNFHRKIVVKEKNKLWWRSGIPLPFEFRDFFTLTVLWKCVTVFRIFDKGLSSMKKLHLFYLIQLNDHWTAKSIWISGRSTKRRSNTEYAKPGHNVQLDGHNCSLPAHYTGLYANYAHMGFKFRYLNFKPMWDLICEANLSARGLHFRNLSPHGLKFL